MCRMHAPCDVVSGVDSVLSQAPGPIGTGTGRMANAVIGMARAPLDRYSPVGTP
jgi:hypothetical protein